ncbi:MAG: hypothetical protein MZV70_03540 [Desulfobacterales bacterium]|nr:hypothetical protein [Desulfobacterales bacterium]
MSYTQRQSNIILASGRAAAASAAKCRGECAKDRGWRGGGGGRGCGAVSRGRSCLRGQSRRRRLSRVLGAAPPSSRRGPSAGASSAVGAAASAGKVYGVLNWLVGSPAVGGVAGPKIPRECTVVEVSSYVTAATSRCVQCRGARIAADERGDEPRCRPTRRLTPTAPPQRPSTTPSWRRTTPGSIWTSLPSTAPPARCRYRSNTTTTLKPRLARRAWLSGQVPLWARPLSWKPVSGSVSAVSSAVATATPQSGIRKEFFNWVVKNPTIGTIAGPKVPEGCEIAEVHGYIHERIVGVVQPSGAHRPERCDHLPHNERPVRGDGGGLYIHAFRLNARRRQVPVPSHQEYDLHDYGYAVICHGILRAGVGGQGRREGRVVRGGDGDSHEGVHEHTGGGGGAVRDVCRLRAGAVRICVGWC